MYYLRSKPSVNPVKFSVKRTASMANIKQLADDEATPKRTAVAKRRSLSIKVEMQEPEEPCEMCSS